MLLRATPINSPLPVSRSCLQTHTTGGCAHTPTKVHACFKHHLASAVPCCVCCHMQRFQQTQLHPTPVLTAVHGSPTLLCALKWERPRSHPTTSSKTSNASAGEAGRRRPPHMYKAVMCEYAKSVSGLGLSLGIPASQAPTHCVGHIA